MLKWLAHRYVFEEAAVVSFLIAFGIYKSTYKRFIYKKLVLPASVLKSLKHMQHRKLIAEIGRNVQRCNDY